MLEGQALQDSDWINIFIVQLSYYIVCDSIYS